MKKLRRGYNFKSAFEVYNFGYVMFDSHPETKAEKAEIKSEEFHGKFGEFHGKELEKKMSTQQANQVSMPNNFEVKFKEVEEIRRMLDPDKLVSHLSNLVKGDSKELEEKFMKAEVASYPDKSEEITSEENHGKVIEFTEKELEGKELEEQYTEQETMDDTEKTVEEMEEVANESSVSTFQSKADKTC